MSTAGMTLLWCMWVCLNSRYVYVCEGFVMSCPGFDLGVYRWAALISPSDLLSVTSNVMRVKWIADSVEWVGQYSDLKLLAERHEVPAV